MLIGEHKHTLDPKKRIAIPARWRRELGKTVVLTRGLDHCLFVYPVQAWQKISQELAALPMGAADSRGFNRFIFAGALEVEVDSLGRVLVPDFLKEFAGLRTKVVLAGVHNRLEIWDERRWQTYKNRVERQADALAEKLGEVGAF